MHDGGKAFEPLNIAILTVSDTRTLAQDTSGDYLQSALLQAGHVLYERLLLTDHLYDIRAAVSRWIADRQCQVVIITGGTGFYDKDITPEAVGVLFDKTVDGFGEVFRQLSQQTIQLSTMQSRAAAGVANRTLVFAVPGSTGACKTAWDDILLNQLDARTKPCNFVPHVRILD
ncbi:MAG: molybdenum cofactor biosynthesis protein B [Gammaproteobacteria bacterium]|nr:MAG: molybdenum cofactor biosynthesis protein B [Gammaproteobacteria bacterium]